jgi:hypothetical protein
MQQAPKFIKVSCAFQTTITGLPFETRGLFNGPHFEPPDWTTLRTISIPAKSQGYFLSCASQE